VSQASIGESPKWGSFIERSLNGKSESFPKRDPFPKWSSDELENEQDST
jgi:hypothetical protein